MPSQEDWCRILGQNMFRDIVPKRQLKQGRIPVQRYDRFLHSEKVKRTRFGKALASTLGLSTLEVMVDIRAQYLSNRSKIGRKNSDEMRKKHQCQLHRLQDRMVNRNWMNMSKCIRNALRKLRHKQESGGQVQVNVPPRRKQTSVKHAPGTWEKPTGAGARAIRLRTPPGPPANEVVVTVQAWPGSQIPIDLFDPCAPPSFEERRREASSRKKVQSAIEDEVLEALGVMGMNRLRNAVKRGDIDLDEIPGMRAGEGTTMFQTVYPLERLHCRSSWCKQIPCEAGLGSGPRGSSVGVVAVEVLLERSGEDRARNLER